MDYIAVTSEDIQAMRAAMRYIVTFADGKVELRLVKEVANAHKGFGEATMNLERTLAGAAFPRELRAQFVVSYATGAWQALCAIVKPGDSLRFTARENGNGYMRAASIEPNRMEGCHIAGYDRLYWDELTVDVVRKDKTVVYGLVLQTSICPNNSARAIRRSELSLV